MSNVILIFVKVLLLFIGYTCVSYAGKESENVVVNWTPIGRLKDGGQNLIMKILIRTIMT